jgi:hypothetical protein
MSRNTSGKDNTDSSRRWAALESKHERLADSAELLLLNLNRDRTTTSQPSTASQPLKAAS